MLMKLDGDAFRQSIETMTMKYIAGWVSTVDADAEMAKGAELQ